MGVVQVSFCSLHTTLAKALDFFFACAMQPEGPHKLARCQTVNQHATFSLTLGHRLCQIVESATF